MEKTYYTVNDLSTKFKVKPETIRRWFKEKKLIGIKIGKLLFFSKEENNIL